MNMLRIKYKTERTLVRKLCRLPGQSPREFKDNVKLLKRHFEQFNNNISELCQWLMRIRPNGKLYKSQTEAFWYFFLQPSEILKDIDEKTLDKYRADLFEIAAGWMQIDSIANLNLPEDAIKSIKFMLSLKDDPLVKRPYDLLKDIDPIQRMILLKAASEWVVSRYLKGYENWERQFSEWKKEKGKWESEHPQLTDDIKNKYSDIYSRLGIKLKNPRICEGKSLLKNTDNCQYAGERIGKFSHSQLCKKYFNFVSGYLKRNKINRKYFIEHTEYYLSLMKDGYAKGKIFYEVLKKEPKATWFQEAFKEYLKQLGLNENTLLKTYGGDFPHCVKNGDECTFNHHTRDCCLYKDKFLLLTGDEQELEPLYREWRKYYYKGPRKPAFKYPSSRELPTPKIFGKDYFKIDLQNSTIQLRLDNMNKNEFLSFGVKPWPKEYDIQPENIDISSIHINFIGNRAKAGFRFKVEHKPSRFNIKQEEIDYLRSNKYPRAYQDQMFLDEARDLLKKSFNGTAERDLRILTIDLGETGCYAAYYEGDKFIKAEPIKIIKTDKLCDKKTGKPDNNSKGLNKEHVGKHLEVLSVEAEKIAQKRSELRIKEQLTASDLRSLTTHIKFMVRDWARTNASQIIKTAVKYNVDLIVFESLRGFGPPGYESVDIEKKRRLAFFAYGIIRRKVTEKAVENGIRVITCPYFNSSQVCSSCHWQQTDKKKLADNKNKKKKKFVCEKCRYEINSDQNAAMVLAKVFWGQIKLPVKYH